MPRRRRQQQVTTTNLQVVDLLLRRLRDGIIGVLAGLHPVAGGVTGPGCLRCSAAHQLSFIALCPHVTHVVGRYRCSHEHAPLAVRSILGFLRIGKCRGNIGVGDARPAVGTATELPAVAVAIFVIV